MIIRRLDIHLVRLPLRRPWVTSMGTEDAVETVLVHAFTDSVDAWTESCPLALPLYSPEYAAGVAALLSRVLGPRVVGRELPDTGALAALLAPIRGNPFAKAALDGAWWALHATERREPLHLLLGGETRPVPVGEGIGIVPDLCELADRVASLAGRGFARIKLKIQPGWELEPLRYLRRHFPDLPLMADCNGSYTPRETPVLKALDELGLLMIEQPFAPPDLRGHAALQAQLRTPLCLDESIASVADADAALALDACRVVNIKPGRVGGISAALAIEARCRAAGLPCWIGGMLETGLGASLNLALATLPGCTLPTVNLCSDRWFGQDIVTPPLEMTAAGVIIPACRPYVGREVDNGLVEELTLARECVEG